MGTSAQSANLRRPNQILSLRDRERLKAQVKSIEARMQGQIDMPRNKNMKEKGMSSRKQGYYAQFQWKQAQESQRLLENQLKRTRGTLERGTPTPLDKKERMVREKQRQEDIEFLRKNLTPTKLYFAKSGTEEFEQGKRAFTRENTPAIQRVKDRLIQNTRALDPDSVDRGLVDKLRPS